MKTKTKRSTKREQLVKYRAAHSALKVAMDRVFEQIFSEWDRDVVSTQIYLTAMHDVLAVAVGSTGTALLHAGVDQDAAMERSMAMSSTGTQINFLKTYRQGKRKKRLAKVIPLPVAR